MGGIPVKTIAFDRIPMRDIAISGITSIYQKPIWKKIGFPQNNVGRQLNGYLLIDRGACTYRYDGEEHTLTHGALIYLPYGSIHTVTRDTDDLAYYRISFTMTDMEDSDTVIFSKQPFLVTEHADSTLFSLADALTKSTFAADMLQRTALLCGFLGHLGSTEMHGGSSPITPAIRYIRDHFTEDLNVAHLAELCFISESHLFRLFRQELGQSPIDYRNSLRIDLAKQLLVGEINSIAEIAASLGFENFYYFSRIFKEKTGLSPSAYRKALR